MNRPPRLGRRTAHRLLDGRSAVRAREQRLARLLDTLAEQEPRRETAIPAHLLDEFARRTQDGASSADSAGRGPRARGARFALRPGPGTGPRRAVAALTVKAAFVLVFSSATVTATVAAAAADALPAPAQLAVHELLGSWGVPAPAARGGPAPLPPSRSQDPPTTPPVSRPAAPQPAVAAGTGRPPPRAPRSNPATRAQCAPFEGAHQPGDGPAGRHGARADGAPGNDAGRACQDESGSYHVGRDGRPARVATGGDPAKKTPGARLASAPGRGRAHRSLPENAEH